MDEALERLLSIYGKSELVADALGYSERQYRNIRRKVRNGEALPARIIELINLKLQQLDDCQEYSGTIHARR